jgi:hypothetical protein
MNKKKIDEGRSKEKKRGGISKKEETRRNM